MRFKVLWCNNRTLTTCRHYNPGSNSMPWRTISQKKLKNQKFIKFLLLHPIARGSSLESSVARRLKSSFISSPFSASLLSRPSIHSASPALFPLHFFLVRPFLRVAVPMRTMNDCRASRACVSMGGNQ